MKVIHTQAANGDNGLKELSHPSLDQRIFREVEGGHLEWAYESEWQQHGWRARTYASVMKPHHIKFA